MYLYTYISTQNSNFNLATHIPHTYAHTQIMENHDLASCGDLRCVQSIATHCSTLQHIAAHCNTLQHTAAHCNARQHTATHSNTPSIIRRSVRELSVTNSRAIHPRPHTSMGDSIKSCVSISGARYAGVPTCCMFVYIHMCT